jgi:hypothetical protein
MATNKKSIPKPAAKAVKKAKPEPKESAGCSFESQTRIVIAKRD